MQKKEKNIRKGFTLVELIVVLVILAILAAFMIPALIQYIERSLEASDLIEVRAAYVDVLAAVTEQDSDCLLYTSQEEVMSPREMFCPIRFIIPSSSPSW